MSLITDFKFAARSLARVKGLAITVIVTLALGIGANAAIFSVVRGVLLRPLVNKDEDRLIYIRQSARGIGAENAKFSVPEIRDLRARVKTLTAFGDFSTIDFTMVGLGEPRVVRAGVVGGSYFDVMGLRPVRGRLLDATDDGPQAAGAAVLTHRFWTTTLGSDPTLIGKTIRLGDRSATIVGVVEPSVPYPAQTEIIANVVTSPHHLSATMVEGRVHRMTDLFARLAPGADLDTARAELRVAHAAMVDEHREAYPPKHDFRIDAVRLRDQITSPARTVLLVLLAASGLIFVIACSNVANLILARSVRREGELAIRAALGAGTGALRQTLLAESLLLCGAGAALGVIIARPMVAVLARYASRFSVRALDLTVDASLLWVGVGLAFVSSVLLAFVPRLPLHHAKHAWWGPRLPSADAANGFGLSNGSVRITSGTNRRLRLFAVTQIAASFVLLAGAGTLITTLFALQRAQTGMNTRNVLVLHVPVNYERPPEQTLPLYKEAIRRIGELPGVERVAVGTVVPWREAGAWFDAQFMVEGYAKADGEEDPRGRFRTVSPGFFAALGVPVIAGRDFNAGDRRDSEKVVIVSQSLAQRLFPNQDAVNRRFTWTDPVMKFIDVSTGPRRIIGIAADIDDENVVPGPAMVVYHPMDQEMGGGRLFVHARIDPYALVPPITKIIRDLSAEQPVERAATLEDVRAEVLAPNRLNALVFGGFAGVALTIAVVGVAGVLAFSVSARTREFGVRLAIGSTPRHLLTRILGEGAVIACAGIAAGVVGGIALARVVGLFLQDVSLPGALPLLGAATLLVAAALLASLMPASRASRVDVVQALRSE
ncbi:MAG: multidrug ABC transporter substrate-binding protein [Acidobacteria bacterium 13_1_40CM_65_14]|nr:MAG: multidrug ABC transporter substrate-binding protein [Acidobacteria bacterium 13_1_40CM_65_14]OLC75684.1 MAG: multidrug ABC transporter substrate-binding protein [Acidobacteria bacterium 13_1_40CM_4_65_8]